MKTRILLTVAILLVVAGAQRAQEPPREALDGTDPVLLVQGKDELGKAQFKAVHEGFEYLFASAETMAEFEKNPAKYAVQFGGLCARMGRTASGNMSDYVVHEGKIYVFGSDACHKLFVAAPAKFLPPIADAVPKDPSALERGRALLDRAAAALGGSRLDSLTSYIETSSQIVRRLDIDTPVKVTTTWRFPDAVRVERSMKIDGRQMSSATLVTRNGAWYQAEGQSYPMIAAARANAAAEMHRQLLPLLRSRADRGVVAALERTSNGELERVRVKDRQLDVILSLDPASAKPRSMTFTDRNGEGEFGVYNVLYEDYQTIDGVTVPFSIRSTFNGQAEPSQSRTLESVQINTAIAADVFIATPKR